MPQRLMDVLMLGRCSHEFSWPRRAPNGEYYQVCLVCASAYQYDWKSMRRGNRVDEPAAETTSVRRRSGQKQPTWMPRARRLRSNLPVRYRGKNLHTWYEGIIQNISQSGVLFHGPQQRSRGQCRRRVRPGGLHPRLQISSQRLKADPRTDG